MGGSAYDSMYPPEADNFVLRDKNLTFEFRQPFDFLEKRGLKPFSFSRGQKPARPAFRAGKRLFDASEKRGMTFPERMMTAEGGRAEIFWEFKKNTIRAKWLAISLKVRTFAQGKSKRSI